MNDTTTGDSEQRAERLDKCVADRFGISRRAAQEAVRNGRVDVDGVVSDEPGRMIDATSRVEYHASRPRARKVQTKLRVLREDRHVIIVDKPAGLLTLRTAEHERDTLVERVHRYLAVRHGGRPYVGVIHRLDKDTSGALAVAKSPQALRAMQQIFKVHDVERQYLTIVEGVPKQTSGTIDLRLVTDRGDLRRGVTRSGDEGRAAVTHYRVVERIGSLASVLACWLETGRTHQIRIHLAELGHPVVGDPVYRPRSRPRFRVHAPRQALHAQTLGFKHPLTGETIAVESPVPPDLIELLQTLRGLAPQIRSSRR